MQHRIFWVANEAKKPITLKISLYVRSQQQYVTRKTDEYISLKINPINMESFYACSTGKSKHKNVPNKSEHKPATNKEASIYIYITTVKNPKNLDVTVSKPHLQIAIY